MKIVIDIPKEIYDVLYVDYVFNPPIRNGKTLFSILQKCIANGTLLPKGHGDLIDRDSLELDTDWNDYYDGYGGYSEGQVRCAPVIIEADRSESE